MENPPAKLSRWILGTFLILVAWLVIGSTLTAIVAKILSLDIGALVGSDSESRTMLASYPPWKSAGAILISWAPLFAVPIILHRFLLGNRPRTLFTRSERPFGREVRIGALAMTVVLVGTSIPDFILNNDDYRLTFEPSRFAPYLLVALTLIPLQTTAEEIFFRGWIQQRIQGWTSSTWLVSLIGGLLFALPHLGNPEVNGELFFAVIGYGATGFMFSWVTMRDRSMGIAVGAHFANNLMAGLIVSTSDSALPSASIWTTPAIAWTPAAASSLIVIPIFIWLTGRWSSKVAS